MYKAQHLEIYFGSKVQKNEFDTWFENQDWEDTPSQEMINMIDEFLEEKQYEYSPEEFEYIEDYCFGKNGNEEEFVYSVLVYLYGEKDTEELYPYYRHKPVMATE